MAVAKYAPPHDFTAGPKLLGDPGLDSSGTRRDITRDQVRSLLSVFARAARKARD